MRTIVCFMLILFLLVLLAGQLGLHPPIHISIQAHDWHWPVSLPGISGSQWGELLVGGVVVVFAVLLLIGCFVLLSASLIAIPLFVVGCVLFGLLSPLLIPVALVVFVLWLLSRPGTSSA